MTVGSLADYERLMRRAKIMEALSAASEYFLKATPETWEKNVIIVLEQLGEAREVHRVYACKNVYFNNELKVFLKYEWKKDGTKNVFIDDLTDASTYALVGLNRWAEVLARGEMICQTTASLPKNELTWNVSPVAEGVIIVPVFVGTEWWGYLGFETLVEGEEQCTRPEVEALQAVATTFGAAIKRKRLSEEIERERASVQHKVEKRTRELTIAQAELKAALFHSKEEKARLTASIHSLSMGFVMTNREGEVLLYNHAVSGILGEINRPWTWPDLAEKFMGLVEMDQTLKTAVDEIKEIRIDDLHYHEKWLRLYFTPIKMVEDDGRVIGVVCLIEDITEYKELQRARDEFFAVASHELRTPLTAIKGNAQLLKRLVPEVNGNPTALEMLKDIETMCDRLSAMVNEYLDVSRLEILPGIVQSGPFNLVEMVANVMRDLEGQAKAKGLAWEMQLPSGVEVMAKADRARSEQVLVNLLANAIKYTDQGGIYVKVESTQDKVKLAVYDTGEGINPEDHGSLFQKFKRAGDRVYTRDVKEGTGMGLYISRLLTEAMGGRIYLEKSQVNVGSGFVVELPKG
ncbi:hypothetical protein A2W24_06510 [Microgenomates group bacterium RBG_16_45_19]|nr:MAG: hypothetical protein A2W24_06510 [Microgenomates group bacterium RBG_16_45_19]